MNLKLLLLAVAGWRSRLGCTPLSTIASARTSVVGVATALPPPPPPQPAKAAASQLDKLTSN